MKGYISLSKNNTWEFVTRDCKGRITNTVDVCDIQYSWKMRMQENTFEIGWSDDVARRTFGLIQHVSAKTLVNPVAPPNLRVVLAANNPDQDVWNNAYNEEYDNIDGMNVFKVITYQEYQQYLKKYGE